MALSPQRIAALRANPGTRAKLPLSALTPAQRQQRLLNQRLNQPVVPGSTLTNRALAREGKAAVQVRYGPQDAQLSGLARDTPGLYDQYLAELAQHQRNVANLAAGQTAANQALTGTLRADPQAAQVAAQQAQDAQARGAAPSAQNATDEQNAAAQRQAMFASFAAQLANQGSANAGYADTLARVVGPGQKLQATAGAGQKLADLKGQEGAYRDQYQAQAVQGEVKNLLAQQALGVNETKAAATITNQQQSQARARGRARRDAQRLKLAESKDATQRANKTGPYAPKAPKGAKKPTAGPGSITTGMQNALLDKVDNAIKYAQQLKAAGTDQATVRHVLLFGVDQKGKNGQVKIPSNDKWAVNAAMDVVYLGGLSKPNIDELHRRGVHIGGHFPIATRVKTLGAVGQNVAQALGQIGQNPTTPAAP